MVLHYVKGSLVSIQDVRDYLVGVCFQGWL